MGNRPFTPGINPALRSAASVLASLDSEEDSGLDTPFAALPTGFQPLDNVTGGGLHPGELTLIGGAPGAGKTVMALQWARNLAAAGVNATYVCYEHEEIDLVSRLLTLEMGALRNGTTGDGEDAEKVRLRMREAASSPGVRLTDVLNGDATTAHGNLQSYAENLHLLKASGRHTDIEALEALVADSAEQQRVLVVDYLQKVAVHQTFTDEADKVTHVTEALKEMALTHRVPIVAIVASDLEGVRSPRLRLHHLRGSSALAFEADVALILNDKFRCVAKEHREYDPLRAATFKNWVVVSVEKNRSGPPGVDLEFEKDFAHFRFNPVGNVVSERLVDDATGVS